MAALGGAASLFGGGDKPPPPPPPVIPAAPASAARTPGAEVKIGDGQTKNPNSATPQYDGFTEKRITGKPLGGLGRGGLGL
jgi:hypothetical protein